MLCPPEPVNAVEFDPTLGRLLAPWLAGGPRPIYLKDLGDARRRGPALCHLRPRRPADHRGGPAMRPEHPEVIQSPEGEARTGTGSEASPSSPIAAGKRGQAPAEYSRSQSPFPSSPRLSEDPPRHPTLAELRAQGPQRPSSRDRQLAGPSGGSPFGGLRHLGRREAGALGASGHARGDPRPASARRSAIAIGTGSRLGIRRRGRSWRTSPSGSTTSTARSPDGEARRAWTESISTT